MEKGRRSLRILEIRARYVRQKHPNDHKAEYPLAVEVVKNGCYMDDLMPSVETDDCWWHGPSFLQCKEDDWPEKKFGKAPEAYKEEGRAKQQYTELLCGNSKIQGRTRPNGLFKMVPDPVKRKARDQDLFGTGDRLD